MAMPRAAMAGGHSSRTQLSHTYTPLAGQTQTVPRLTVDANDFFYFMDAYIAYYANHIYNPYADITAQGKINGSKLPGIHERLRLLLHNLRSNPLNRLKH